MDQIGAAERPGRLVCLGEALVDLICPERLADRREARSFEVHCGGALANVAVAAARAGAPAALAGGCGADEWGALLADRLTAEGVDMTHYTALDGVATPFAFAYFDLDGEVHFDVHGEGIDDGIASLAGAEEELLDGTAALAFGSNSLVGERSLAVTRRAAQLARQAGVTTMFDPNLRPGRWRDPEQARRRCLDLAGLADVIKCNVAEVRWLLGDERLRPAGGAEALLELGASLAVVTDGPNPAIARGAGSAEVVPPPTDVVSQLGAGDALMGTLAAGLLGGLSAENVEVAVPAAVAAGAAACTFLGALR